MSGTFVRVRTVGPGTAFTQKLAAAVEQEITDPTFPEIILAKASEIISGEAKPEENPNAVWVVAGDLTEGARDKLACVFYKTVPVKPEVVAREVQRIVRCVKGINRLYNEAQQRRAKHELTTA